MLLTTDAGSDLTTPPPFEQLIMVFYAAVVEQLGRLPLSHIHPTTVSGSSLLSPTTKHHSTHDPTNY